MLKQNGEQDLRNFTENTFQESVEEIVPGVWIALSIGHSNAIFIEGNTSIILIDTLDTGKRGERLREIIHATTGKEVGTIIYTHSHVDHRGGGGAFDPSDPETIAFSPCVPVLEHSGMVQDILNKRGARQFGFTLSDEENISQGIGIRTGAVYGESRAFRKPTVVYNQDQVIREIDGVTVEMTRIQGETDDQIMVWLPEKKCSAAAIIIMAAGPISTPSGAASTGISPPGSEALTRSVLIRRSTCCPGIRSLFAAGNRWRRCWAISATPSPMCWKRPSAA